MLAGLITTKVLGIALGGALLAGGLGIGVQTLRLGWTQEGLDQARQQLAQAEARLVAMGAQIERQNAAVGEWQAKAEQAAQIGRRAREEAGRVVAEHRRSADALAAAVAAARGASSEGLTCETGLGVVRADLVGR